MAAKKLEIRGKSSEERGKGRAGSARRAGQSARFCAQCRLRPISMALTRAAAGFTRKVRVGIFAMKSKGQHRHEILLRAQPPIAELK